MALAALLLILALLLFGTGIFIKGFLWLLIIAGVLLLAGAATGIHSRQRH